MPNQLNNAKSEFSHRDIIPVLYLQSEFDKNADSVSVGTGNSFYAELVWRLSEFAFFGALTSVDAFFYFHRKKITECDAKHLLYCLN